MKKSFPRRKLVINAALDEFISNEYEKASLNTIIKSSGISKGVFYYHFKNKEDLYLSLLKESVEAKWKYINEQTRNHHVDFNNMDIFDKFTYQAELGLGFATLHPKYHALGRMLSKGKNNPIYQVAIKALGTNSNDMLTTMIKEAIARHELKPEFGEDFIVKILSHLLLEFDQIFDDESDSEKDKALNNLKNYVKFIKYGLKA